MGCGTYSVKAAAMRGAVFESRSREQIFKSTRLFSEMDIKGKVRECCETDEHPNTLPIIIALDVTGSMGYIPEILIKKQLPKIVGAVKEAGIEHPEICFCAIGDDIYDDAPIQVGQFESSDELIEKWLTHCWLESGGGGNGQESYNLAHYFAAYHTKCDAFNRGQKGVLITIGDEKCELVVSKHTIKSLFDDDVEKDVKSENTLEECLKNWNVFHININDNTSRRLEAESHWKELLGEKNVITINKTDDMEDLTKAVVSCLVDKNILASSDKDLSEDSTNSISML